jgi:hypothetical protein
MMLINNEQKVQSLIARLSWLHSIEFFAIKKGVNDE